MKKPFVNLFQDEPCFAGENAYLPVRRRAQDGKVHTPLEKWVLHAGKWTLQWGRSILVHQKGGLKVENAHLYCPNPYCKILKHGLPARKLTRISPEHTSISRMRTLHSREHTLKIRKRTFNSPVHIYLSEGRLHNPWPILSFPQPTLTFPHQH